VLAFSALLIAVMLALLVAVFDWTWFRPVIQHFIHERSGRNITFDHLRLGLTPDLDPLVEFRGLRVENAAWAAQRPLAEAGLLRFEFAWQSFTGPRITVNRAVLVDARIDLERSADELRNWRLSNPMDRGPGRIRVLSLDATRSSIRFADHGVPFDAEVHVTPLPAPQVLAAAPALPLVKHLRFEGGRGAARFEGEADVSAIQTMADTGQPFALRGQIRAAGARAQLEGHATDVRDLAALDLDLQLDVPRLDQLRPLLPALPWPALPLAGTAHLAKTGEVSHLTALKARVGRSDAGGELHVDTRDAAGDVPLVRADLRSAALMLDEIEAGLAALPPRTAAPARPFDADVAWRAARLTRAAAPWLDSLAVQAQWRRGRLALAPFDLGVAGGHVAGSLQVDTTAAPRTLALDARLHGVRAERFALGTAAARGALQGAVNGHATLRARGDTLTALTRSLAGTLTAALQGGTVTPQLDARLALDGGALLRSWLADPARVAVRCARVALDFDNGRGRLRRLGFETDRVALSGGGSVDLGARAVDLVLMPQRKGSALLALDRSIKITGPFAKPAIALTEPRPAAAAPACGDPSG
jgi:uncharacterized protein involved in outer membrane biogenesis